MVISQDKQAFSSNDKMTWPDQWPIGAALELVGVLLLFLFIFFDNSFVIVNDARYEVIFSTG